MTPHYDYLLRAIDNPSENLNGSNQEDNYGWKDTPHYLLAKSIADGNAGAADIASSVRMVARYEELKAGHEISLPLPDTVTTLLRARATGAGLNFETDGQKTRVWATRWHPAWLPGADHYDIDAPVANLERENPNHSCPPDPVLAHFGLDHYLSPAQRSAVRAVMSAPPGHTVAIGLPTGAGKSLCTFLPAVMTLSAELAEPGVTVMITPTVALAYDLERRLKKVLKHDVVYRGKSMNAEASLAIRSRCETGEQGPVIISPESLAGLMPSLRLAAERGYLRYFVIDEAHMVLNWGDEFRPHFQQTAPLRRELLEVMAKYGQAQFVTVLMSATLTEYHLTWLSRLFADNETFSFYHASRLRPEPAYWLAKAPSVEQRRSWVLECAYKLPKPLIIYTTTIKECNAVVQMLKGEGFLRVNTMTSKSTDTQRQALMEQWMSASIDVVVATSAFGLGVDKPNVRSVIHAQLPESVDRFYQDVGRSGRDTKASVSVLIWEDADWTQIPSNPRFISEELGIERWQAMRASWRPHGAEEGIYHVDVEAPRVEGMDGEQNEKWNLRTLFLMQRAGLLNFAPEHQREHRYWSVRPTNLPHTDPQTWRDIVTPIRDQLASEYTRSSKLLRQLLMRNKECISAIFSNCYESSKFHVSVACYCGGCPHCRAEHTEAIFPAELRIRASLPQTNSRFKGLIGEGMQRLLNAQKGAFIFYNEWREEGLIELLAWCARQGIPNFAPRQTIGQWLASTAKESKHLPLFVHDSTPEPADASSKEPIVFVLQPRQPLNPRLWEAIQSRGDGEHFILVGPESLAHPERQRRNFREMVTIPCVSFAQWRDEFSS